MQQLLGFISLIVFFICFKFYDIYIATYALIGCSFLQIIADKVFFGGFKKYNIYMFLILTVFGSLTIVMHDPNFLKWKLTIVELAMATILLVSQFVFKKPLVGYLFKNLNVPSELIKKINIIASCFFIFIAILNLIIAFGLPLVMEEEKALNYWVNFKVWGVMILSFGLMIVIGKYVYPYIVAQTDENKDEKNLKIKK